VVVKDGILLVHLKVVEVTPFEGEVAFDVLADGNGALLPINDFEVSVITYSQYMTFSGKSFVMVSMTASRCLSL